MADKTTSLQYGPPAGEGVEGDENGDDNVEDGDGDVDGVDVEGCLTAGLLPLFVGLAGLFLTFAHFLHLRLESLRQKDKKMMKIRRGKISGHSSDTTTMLPTLPPKSGTW